MAEQKVEALERAFRLLDCFTEQHSVLTLKQLAEETGLYKSTILRLAGSMERYGYLQRDEDGRFRLGPTVVRLGALYRREFQLSEHIRPVLRRLVDQTRESASFYVRDGETRVCLFRENSTQAIRHHIDEGAQFTLDRGAAGHLLRAFDEPPPPASDKRAQDVRAAGYALSLGERDPDTASIAVPVWDADGRLAGALTVSGLATRFGETERQAALEAALAASQDLSRRLGRR